MEIANQQKVAARDASRETPSVFVIALASFGFSTIATQKVLDPGIASMTIIALAAIGYVVPDMISGRSDKTGHIVKEAIKVIAAIFPLVAVLSGLAVSN